MSGRVWVGSFFILFGVGFLMQVLGMVDFVQVLSTWWPIALIIVGIIQLITRTYSSIVSGLLFLLIGTVFLANNLTDVNMTTYLWPLLLIFIGLVFLFTRTKRGRRANTDENIHTFSLFAGTDVRSQSKDFQGGNITTIFGGAEIDLREAIISDGAKLDLTTVFGGISITVPENVQVEVKGIPIFGGWEDKTRHYSNEEKATVLTLNCLTVAGGIEIKN
ncbi:DUF5668 domain-containing protein [Pseudogracilibacillus sp. SE30717A]|uniref:LiaF transmembrane domain-containing protein n=1 Tax=Pseudogracilibacillus sp. SE30717A TaxID=3098293 RepID=UPI00300E0777